MDEAIGGGPVCFKANQTASPFLQLETGFGSRSNRCISKGMVYNSGICQPTMVPDISMPHQGEGTSCKNDPSSSTLEDSVMVSSPAGAVLNKRTALCSIRASFRLASQQLFRNSSFFLGLRDSCL